MSKSLKKIKKQYFAKLNVKEAANNKLFKNVKPYFNDKGSNSTKITLVEKDIIITDEKQIANIMNEHFVSITKKLSLKPSISLKNSNSDIFNDHISIKKFKEIYPEIVANSFKFGSVTKDNIKYQIQNLNVKKSSTFGCIPVTILKDCIDVYLVHLTNSVNHSLQASVFQQKLKQPEVIPLYKKLDPLSEENYRPVSLLPHLSKVFERIIYKQVNSYMEVKFAKCLTGFRKPHGTQHSLLTMLEKWIRGIDNGSHVSALFMDLSKGFDTINHGLILTKLKAYGFSTNALYLMHSYLKKTHTKKFKLITNLI